MNELSVNLAKNLAAGLALDLSATDPFVALNADRAWRADDAVDNGSVTTSLPNYVGSLLSLSAQGTGQAKKAVASALGGRLAISCATTAGLGAYGNVDAFAAMPASFSVATVVRFASNSRGAMAVTVGGTINTGVSQIQTASTASVKVASSATSAGGAPASRVIVSVFTAAGITSYVNSLTPATASVAGALVGTRLHICGIASSEVFVLDGLWATTGYWARALSAIDAAFVLTQLGRRYGVSISA
jgi:hypothetical protein